jgi:hypothetical protein
MQEWRACARSGAREFTVSGWGIAILRYPRIRSKREFAAADARNFREPLYQPLSLSAGDVLFDEVVVLQAGEFHGEAVLDMTDHAALGLSDGNYAADRRPQFRRN